MESDASTNEMSGGDAPVHPTTNTDTENVAAHTKALETALKASLRMIDALVGRRVDLQNSKKNRVNVLRTGEKLCTFFINTFTCCPYSRV